MLGYCNKHVWILILLDITIDIHVPAWPPAGSILCEHSELIFAAGGQTVHTRLGVLVRLQFNISVISALSWCQTAHLGLGELCPLLLGPLLVLHHVEGDGRPAVLGRGLPLQSE